MSRNPFHATTRALRLTVTNGVCANSTVTADDDPWFPDTPRGARSKHRLRELAAHACAGCPFQIQQSCVELGIREALRAAGESPTVHGVWGGLAPHDLTRLAEARLDNAVQHFDDLATIIEQCEPEHTGTSEFTSDSTHIAGESHAA